MTKLVPGSNETRERHPLLDKVELERVPAHVAIIMDGNGRWATSRGLPRIEGHKEGIQAVRRAVEAASDLGVSHLTLYAFSMENWKRPKMEVEALFHLLERFLTSEAKTLVEKGIRFRSIGRKTDLPKKVQRLIHELEAKTKGGKWTLTLALSYGGRTEIADACSALVEEAIRGKFSGPVGLEDLAGHLYAPDLPDPDLLIRTSGECRVSNFLLWQLAYTEILILDVLWPDFAKEDFFRAVLDYQRRERRYGGVFPPPNRDGRNGGAGGCDS